MGSLGEQSFTELNHLLEKEQHITANQENLTEPQQTLPSVVVDILPITSEVQKKNTTEKKRRKNSNNNSNNSPTKSKYFPPQMNTLLQHYTIKPNKIVCNDPSICFSPSPPVSLSSSIFKSELDNPSNSPKNDLVENGKVLSLSQPQPQPQPQSSPIANIKESIIQSEPTPHDHLTTSRRTSRSPPSTKIVIQAHEEIYNRALGLIRTSNSLYCFDNSLPDYGAGGDIIADAVDDESFVSVGELEREILKQLQVLDSCKKIITETQLKVTPFS